MTETLVHCPRCRRRMICGGRPAPHHPSKRREVERIRALEAVARAAQVEARGWEHLYGEGNVNARHPLVRALERLRDVSRATPKRPAPRRSAPRTPASMPRNAR